MYRYAMPNFDRSVVSDMAMIYMILHLKYESILTFTVISSMFTQALTYE